MAVRDRVRVGIDLAPAAMTERAPGTARHVTEQARALFNLDVPWTWRPFVESTTNPLYSEIEHLGPVVVSGTKVSQRVLLRLGTAYRRERCSLGFGTAFFVPLVGPPVVANFFDATLYTHGHTWIESGERLNLWLTRFLATSTVRRARRLFVLSQDAERRLAHAFPRQSSKVRVIPSGPGALSGVAQPSQPLWSKRVGQQFFLNVGRFSANKGQVRLLDCWARLQSRFDDLPGLVCAGSYDAEYFAREIQPRLTRLPFPDRVAITGHVPEAELAWAFANALAYLQPSLTEGFGLPVIEAMNHNLPVGCSSAAALVEVAGDAALFFDAVDPRSLDAAVLQLWRDAGVRMSLVHAGAVRRERYSWQRNAKATATEINTVLRELSIPITS